MDLTFKKFQLTEFSISVRKPLLLLVICAGFSASLFVAGCGEAELAGQRITRTEKENHTVYKPYEPAGIEVVPLTEIRDSNDGNSVIELYISLVDKYGESVKAPVELRFELYNYIERSGRIKGSRVFMWTDIDITDFEINSKKWQQHLDAYRFELNLDKDIQPGGYVLQCTCTTASGARINKDYVLDY